MKNNIMISIVMPNEKDLEVMDESVNTLESLEISNEVMVISTHRAAEQIITYAKNARNRD